MLFLAGVIAIVLLQLWGTAERVHRDGWFDSWRERLQGAGLSGGGGLLVAVAVYVAACLLFLLALRRGPHKYGAEPQA